MTKLRDEKGRYVKRPWLTGDMYFGTLTLTVVVLAFVAIYLLLWPPPEVIQAPVLPARVITVPSAPINWDLVTVHAIPDDAWQAAHDQALLKQVGKELQRVLDRNEQIAQPQFSQH